MWLKGLFQGAMIKVPKDELRCLCTDRVEPVSDVSYELCGCACVGSRVNVNNSEEELLEFLRQIKRMKRDGQFNIRFTKSLPKRQ